MDGTETKVARSAARNYWKERLDTRYRGVRFRCGDAACLYAYMLNLIVAWEDQELSERMARAYLRTVPRQ